MLVKDNPILLPLNVEKTVYDGFITVQVRECLQVVRVTTEQRYPTLFYTLARLTHGNARQYLSIRTLGFRYILRAFYVNPLCVPYIMDFYDDTTMFLIGSGQF